MISTTAAIPATATARYSELLRFRLCLSLSVISQMAIQQISIAILEKRQIFTIFICTTIQSIYTNLPNGKSVVNIKIVNIYLFPKWTELPLS